MNTFHCEVQVHKIPTGMLDTHKKKWERQLRVTIPTQEGRCLLRNIWKNHIREYLMCQHRKRGTVGMLCTIPR